MSDDFRKFLKVRLASLEIEKRHIGDLLRIDRLDDGVGSSNGVGSSTRHIHAPIIVACKTHPDLVIELLKVFPDGLTEEEIINCLEPVIETKAKNRRKAVMDAISLLVRSHQIQKLRGVYRLIETPIR